MLPPAAPPPPLPVAVSYFGETASHPGLALGVERPVAASGAHALFFSLLGAGYTHPRNHHGLLLNAELGYRWGRPAGLSWDAGIGIGSLYTLLAAPVYGTGGWTSDAGRPTLAPSVALGMGHGLAAIGLPGRRAFIRLLGFGEYPFNTYVLPHVALQAGLQWGIAE